MEELCRPLVAMKGSDEGKVPQGGFLLRQLKHMSSLHKILQIPGTEDAGRLQT